MLKNLRPLFPYLRKYQATFWVGALFVLCNNSVAILVPAVIRNAIDDLNLGVTAYKLKWYAFELLAVAGTKAIFQFLTRWILIGVSREIEFDLRNDLFTHLERLSYGFVSGRAPATSWPAPPTTSMRCACWSARESCTRPTRWYLPRARWPSC